MDRRQFLKLAVVGLGGLALTGGGLYLSRKKEDYVEEPLFEDYNKIKRKIDSPEFQSKLNSLTTEQQNKIIQHMDNFILTKTDIGKVAKQFLGLDIETRLETKLRQGHYTYNLYHNYVAYNTPTNELQILQYLRGEPLLFAQAHERAHAVQDKSSKWDRFETFFKDFIPQTRKPRMKITFSKRNAKHFAVDFLKKPGASYNESAQGFTKLWTQYDTMRTSRLFIWETQAHLIFEGYRQPKHLHKRIVKGDNLLKIASQEKADQVFHNTIELLGLVDPFKATLIAGQCSTISEYQTAVDKLKKQIPNAFKRGIARQNRLLYEIYNIITESIDCIDNF